MKLSKLKQQIFQSKLLNSLLLLIFIGTFFCFPISSWSFERASGEELFIQHCSGCHVNGGNIIRRGKNLKLSALKRYGIDSPEEIAKIARLGTGSMSGYQEVLGEGGDQLVANWIWEKAQNAWIHG